ATPTPVLATPYPTPTRTPSGEAGATSGLHGQFVYLADHAREMLPMIRRLIEKPLLGLLQRISWVLASLILVFSFLRVLRENNGASSDFYYWVARGAFWMNLLVIGPFVVGLMLIVG